MSFVEEQDLPSDETTIATIALGEIVRGTIGTPHDIDSYRISVEAGVSYLFTADGVPSSFDQRSNVQLQLFREGNDAVRPEGWLNVLGYTPAEDQDVFLLILAGGADAGAYTIELEQINDIAGGDYTSATIEVGEVVQGRFDFEQDKDWYRVDVEQGATYVFSSPDSSNTEDEYYNIWLWDAEGDPIGSTFSYGTIAYTSDIDGHIFVSAAPRFQSSLIDYTLALEEVVDVPAGPETEETIAAGETVIGVMDDRNDHDWYRAELSAGVSYVFRVDAQATGDLDGTNAPVTLRRADGTPLSIGFRQELYTPEVDEVIYADVGFSSTRGGYALSLQEVFDVRADPLTSQSLIVGRVETGELQSFTDEDWHRVALVEGGTYAFSVSAPDDPFAMSANNLALFDSNSNWLPLAPDPESSFNAYGEYTAEFDQFAFVSVSGAWEYIGSYNLHADLLYFTRYGTFDHDYMLGSDGDDFFDGRAGDDQIFGLDGDDELIGAGGADLLFGGAGADEISGGADDDEIRGGMDDDTILGGGGDDALFGGAGDDWINGGFGDDTIYGNTGEDVIRGGEGRDHILGGGGDDKVFGQSGEDAIVGGVGDDFISGGDGNDNLFGQAGNDRLEGGAGDDRLTGNAGDDVILGLGGRDVIVGGPGNDLMAGGEGADVFVFLNERGENVVQDFEVGVDRLNFASRSFNDDRGVVFADLTLSQSGSDVLVVDRGLQVLLENVEFSTLSEGDFIF